MHYLIGDVYLWPAVAYFFYELNGVEGMRFVAALLGTFSVWIVYGITVSFLQRLISVDNVHRNRHDMLSYRPLFTAASKKGVLFVAPEAKALIPRLSSEYHDIQWTAQNMSFKEWVNNGYPGIFDKT